MKKESFDILADFFHAANTINKLGEGDASISAKTVIEFLSRLTIIEMVGEKVGKLNLWDFVDQDKSRLANMIFHKDGFLLASNRRMLIKIKREYSPELEGKGLRRNGVVETRTPLDSFDRALAGCIVYHRDMGSKEIVIDFDKFDEVSKQCKALVKMSHKTIRPIISIDGGGAYFYYDELAPAIQFMRDLSIDKMSICPNKSVAAMITKDDNFCLVMPVIGDFRQMGNIFEL